MYKYALLNKTFWRNEELTRFMEIFKKLPKFYGYYVCFDQFLISHLVFYPFHNWKIKKLIIFYFIK